MTYSRRDWWDRFPYKTDYTLFLTHLTRKTDSASAMDVLLKILKEKTIIGSTTNSGYIVGERAAVCFQDSPIYSLAQNWYYEKKQHEANSNYKIRYSPIGLQFDKQFIYKKGGRPVFYEKSEIAKGFIHPEEHWRIVSLDLSDSNNIVDWTHEREWRVPGNLEFEYKDVSIIVHNTDNYKLLFKELEIDILSEIKGINVIGNILG